MGISGGPDADADRDVTNVDISKRAVVPSVFHVMPSSRRE
jgi:hypothetical protein